jgi:hypothetical protein
VGIDRVLSYGGVIPGCVARVLWPGLGVSWVSVDVGWGRGVKGEMDTFRGGVQHIQEPSIKSPFGCFPSPLECHFP